jgi:hypothetical protein
MDEIHRSILSFAAHDDMRYRILAPRTLAHGWHEDAGTLPLLRELAVADADEDVRRTALVALTTYYHEDAGTLPLLRERAENAQSGWMRDVAKKLADKLEQELRR